MNLADVMDDLGTALETIEGLRVTAYYADRVSVPAAVVGFPDSYDFDQTMSRGSDRVTFPVTVLVGKADARSARDQLAAYCDGAGDSSVKAAVDRFVSTAWDSARVTAVEFGVITVSGVEYLGATFDVEVFG